MKTRFFLFVILVLCLAGLAAAQTDTARLVGTITDPTGAVIPNATFSARGLGLSCLPSGLKRFMRPRIYHTGFDRTSPGARFDLADKIVNI